MTTPEQLTLDVQALAGATAATAERCNAGGREAEVEVRGDPEPGRRAAVLDLRVDHGALGRLLQVQQLRHDERLRVRESSKLVSSKF